MPEHYDSDDSVVSDFSQRRQEIVDHLGKWRDEAIEDLKFASGDQWPNEAQKAMRSQKRAFLTFNQLAPLIDTVSGSRS